MPLTSYTDRDRHREKTRAKTRKLLNGGQLERAACAHCGESEAIAHHPDYDDPAFVIWLCRSCHSKHHANTPDVTRDNESTLHPRERMLQQQKKMRPCLVCGREFRTTPSVRTCSKCARSLPQAGRAATPAKITQREGHIYRLPHGRTSGGGARRFRTEPFLESGTQT